MAPDEPSRITPARKESLLSPATADTFAGMFTQLAAFRREQRRSTEFPMGGAERTLEDVVRELLNPMMARVARTEIGADYRAGCASRARACS
jgi:cell pole-organizing protein PopZ